MDPIIAKTEGDAPADMKRTRRSQAQRRAEAEQRLLEAAVRIVADRGLDEFTLADVGEQAGYSSGLPAHYFRTKNELITAVAAYIRDWVFAGIRDHAGRRPGLNGLIAGIRFYFDAASDSPELMRALHTVLAGALHKPAVAAAIEALNRDSIEITEANIRAGIDNGEIRRGLDARIEAVLILAAVRGAIAQWLIDPEMVDLAAARTVFITSLRQRLRR